MRYQRALPVRGKYNHNGTYIAKASNETGNNLPDEAMQLSVENRNILAAHSPGSRSLLTLAISYENMNDVRHFHCERSLDLSYNTVLPRGRPPPGMSEGSDW